MNQFLESFKCICCVLPKEEFYIWVLCQYGDSLKSTFGFSYADVDELLLSFCFDHSLVRWEHIHRITPFYVSLSWKIWEETVFFFFPDEIMKIGGPFMKISLRKWGIWEGNLVLWWRPWPHLLHVYQRYWLILSSSGRQSWINDCHLQEWHEDGERSRY